MGVANLSIALNSGAQDILAQPIVLPPGDWDVEAYLIIPTPNLTLDSAAFNLSPQPPGFSDAMATFVGMAGTQTPEFNAIVVSPRVQALVTVPTLMPFTVELFNTNMAGTGTLTVTARRMR
jgi:hypothetical protein